MLKLKIFLNHLFNIHSLSIMPIFSDEKCNGWYCPYCDWKHYDIADFKMKNIDEHFKKYI